MTENKMTAKDYISSLKPIWCPGCGDYGVLNALAAAFAEMGRPTEEIAVVSGIGCSSRLPGYLNTYGFNGIHGRALPIACGLKIARPELEVVVVGGDGDGFSIGGNHIPHMVRRNVDLTYFLMDNSIYALTKGQLSPTTLIGTITSTSKYGSIENPIKPCRLLLSYGATFVAQATPLDIKKLTKIMVLAMKHPGFAYVNILSPCVTYKGKNIYQVIKDRIFYVEDTEGYDPEDDQKAYGLLSDPNKSPIGILYNKPKRTYHENLDVLRKKAGFGSKITYADERKLFLP